MSFSIRPPMTAIGPVHVRMTGVVRGDEKGPGVEIVNAPTTAEATAELHRVARVSGADNVVSVAADYRRAALAGGTTSTQWRIEVQAWGTAMAPAKVEPAEAPEPKVPDDDGRTKDAKADQKVSPNDATDPAARSAPEVAEPAPAQPAPMPKAAPAPGSADTAAPKMPESGTPPPPSR